MDRVETPFRESLVIRLHSEIDQIHLSIEAQCVTTLLPLGDCHIGTFSHDAAHGGTETLSEAAYQEMTGNEKSEEN